ncbi:MAG: FAD-binding monooxygenase [Richelia sp. RM2_1_2]|nr:FAD-binding monooxygenase [Richelia sp. SM1_7_0]NJN10756.1 FAD-binding monooxygenase [Richelia sp. RM1_1_1]NJO26126.1 FAD-binding monooxygenase [Richelia sp. SL_2_1]NJO58838.1 FAD-binding monooxygenase [Richelia sp. RM2_1_2]
MKNIKTEVLIVGGGPVGMAMAAELRYQGIDCILIEKTDGVVRDPKVSTVGYRSMEFCRRWGISEQIRNAGWDKNHTLDVAWVTTVGGHEIFRVNLPSYAQRTPPDYAPETEQVCPQHWFAPEFINYLGQYPQGCIKLLSQLEDFNCSDDGIVAKITNLDSGNTQTIHASYMVASDGARANIRKQCGVDAVQYHDTQVFQSVVFQAPELASQLGSKNAMVFFLVNPTIQEPLRAVDGKGQYRLILKPQENGQIHDAYTAIKAAISIDTPIEVISNLPWRLTHRVAEKFRYGRIFFIGDCAHTLSPSGGFGMNTGIGDAVDLGWKLAATIKGWAGKNLLDTYEIERRPIALRNLEAANANLQRTQKRSIPPEIASDSPQGEAIRKQMAQGMETSGVKKEFDAPGVHLGFRYQSPIVIPDGLVPQDGVTRSRSVSVGEAALKGLGLSVKPPAYRQWTQSSYPGCRAPHAWLKPGLSTLDLFGHGFTLMCFNSNSNPGIEKLQLCCQQKQVPLTTHHLDNPDIAKLYERAFVLVRPDGHVAWRGDEIPHDVEMMIDQVRGELN